MSETRKRRKSKFVSFERCKMFAQSLEIRTCAEWIKMPKPKNIPTFPHQTYKHKGWTNWYDFLCKTKQGGNTKEFMPYEEAEKWVRERNIKSIRQFRNATRKPDNLPSNPEYKYRGKGWISWMHFFGKIDENGNPCEKEGLGIYRRLFLTYEEARKYLIDRGIKTVKEYRKKRPIFLPIQPEKIYKGKGWQSWYHYCGKVDEKGNPLSRKELGTHKKQYLEYEDARKYLKEKGINCVKDYKKHRPSCLPPHPYEIYKGKGWQNWYHYFDKEHKRGRPSKTDMLE